MAKLTKGKAQGRPMEPRWLGVDDAARYVGARADVFLRAVKAGKLPAPSLVLGAKTPRWDRDALDERMAGGSTESNIGAAVNGVVAQIEAEGRARRAAREARRNNSRVSLPGV